MTAQNWILVAISLLLAIVVGGAIYVGIVSGPAVGNGNGVTELIFKGILSVGALIFTITVIFKAGKAYNVVFSNEKGLFDLNKSYDNLTKQISTLKEEGFPKNVREVLGRVETLLNQSPPDVHKALQELEEIVDSSDLESFVRTQLWDLMSALETL